MSETPMPSPAAAAAPVVAPVVSVPAPVSVPETAAPLDLKNATDADLAARYGVKDEPSEEPTVVIERDAPAPEPAAEAAPAEGEVEAEPVPAPVAEPKVIAAPITPFSVFDGEGEVEIPDIRLTFTAGKKTLEQVPLDKVVRMAQAAPLAEQYREQATTLEAKHQEATTAYQQAVQTIEQNNALYEQLLTNPDLYVKAVEAYQQLHSPEARAQRAEAALQEARTQRQQDQQRMETQQSLAEAYQYAEQRIVPAVHALETQYASVIDKDEIADRFYRLTADLLEAGPQGKPWVPPAKLAEVERRVAQDLTAWAATVAQKRTQSHASATEQATTQVQKAQQDAQAAKRQLARVTAPARTAVTPDLPREKPIKTANDAVEAALEKVRRQVRGTAA